MSANEEGYPDTGLWAVVGRLSLVAMAGATLIASFAPAQIVPHLIYSYHLEHFAAYYLLAMSASAAFVRRDLLNIGLALWFVAFTIEGLRMFEPTHRLTAMLDWFADASGVLAALTPIALGKFRNSFAPASRAETASG